jgi:transposase-like protein
MTAKKPSLIVVPPQPPSDTPDPEVTPKATRRTFSAAAKLRILQEADACTQPGEIGALLRREGLYSSHLVKWRRLRAAGQLQALSPHSRGRQASGSNPIADELMQLRRENTRLHARLTQAETIIDVQKKLSQLLGVMLPVTSSDERS